MPAGWQGGEKDLLNDAFLYEALVSLRRKCSFSTPQGSVILVLE
jgi:hypothetical protein